MPTMSLSSKSQLRPALLSLSDYSSGQTTAGPLMMRNLRLKVLQQKLGSELLAYSTARSLHILMCVMVLWFGAGAPVSIILGPLHEEVLLGKNPGENGPPPHIPSAPITQSNTTSPKSSKASESVD